MSEQLRTIHLTLLLVCLVLVAASLSEHRGPLNRAYQQAVLINKWRSRNREIPQQLLKQATWQLPRQDSSLSATASSLEKWPYVQLRVNGRVEYAFNRTPPLLYGAASGEEFHLRPLNDSAHIGDWETLQNFIDTWTDSHIVVRNPLSGAKFDVRQPMRSQCGEVMLEPSAVTERGTYYNPFTFNVQKGQLFVNLALARGDEECEVNLPFTKPEGGYVDIRRALKDILDGPISTTTFKEAFPDLSDATKYLTSLTLDQLENYLRDQANKEGEKVELFGAKIPYDLVSLFGATLLVACQFYMWCHLLRVESCISTGSTLEDFTGYIGFYKERLSIRLFTLSSVSILPVGTLVLALWSARRDEWWRWTTAIVAILLSSLLGFLLTRQFRAIWNLESSVASTPIKDEAEIAGQ